MQGVSGNRAEKQRTVTHSRERFETIRSIQRRNASSLFQIPGVNAVGVGFEYENGQNTDKIGTVEPGKRADLILVDGDPLTDVTILEEGRAVVLVMKDGQVYADRRSTS